jgi:hypothetical protein
MIKRIKIPTKANVGSVTARIITDGLLRVSTRLDRSSVDCSIVVCVVLLGGAGDGGLVVIVAALILLAASIDLKQRDDEHKRTKNSNDRIDRKKDVHKTKMNE